MTIAKNNFRRWAKMRLLDRNWTITKLAKKIGRSRKAVGIAINQGRFRDTMRRVEAALK